MTAARAAEGKILTRSSQHAEVHPCGGWVRPVPKDWLNGDEASRSLAMRETDGVCWTGLPSLDGNNTFGGSRLREPASTDEIRQPFSPAIAPRRCTLLAGTTREVPGFGEPVPRAV